MKDDGLEGQDIETIMRGMGKILLRAAEIDAKVKQLIHENQQLKEQIRAMQPQQPQQYQPFQQQQYQQPQQQRPIYDRPEMPEF